MYSTWAFIWMVTPLGFTWHEDWGLKFSTFSQTRVLDSKRVRHLVYLVYNTDSPPAVNKIQSAYCSKQKAPQFWHWSGIITLRHLVYLVYNTDSPPAVNKIQSAYCSKQKAPQFWHWSGIITQEASCLRVTAGHDSLPYRFTLLIYLVWPLNHLVS